MSSTNTLPKIVAPPAPPVDQLSAGGQPTITPAPPAQVEVQPVTPEESNVLMPTPSAGKHPAAQPATPKAPDLNTAHGRAEQYVRNLETQRGGEQEYSNWLYQNHPDEYKKANPRDYYSRKIGETVHNVVTSAAERGVEHDPETIKQAIKPHVDALAETIASQAGLGIIPTSGESEGIGPTEGLAATPIMPEGLNFEDLGGKQVLPNRAERAALHKGAAEAFEQGNRADFGPVPKNLGPQQRPGHEEVAPAPQIIHRENVSTFGSGSPAPQKMNQVQLKLGNKEIGRVNYTLNPDNTASVKASHVEPEFRGKGYGQQMYLRTADEARARGAQTLTSDLQGSTSMDAAQVWDKLAAKGHPVEKIPSKAGSPGYKMDLTPPDFQKSVESAGGVYVGNKNGTVEAKLPRSMTENLPIRDAFKDNVSITVPEAQATPTGIKAAMDRKISEMGGISLAPITAAIEEHPALKALSNQYETGDVTKSAKYEPSFIKPNGQMVYLGQEWHPDAIAKTAPDYKGTEDDRTRYINDTGAIRVRPNMDQREGETYHITVPESGVTSEQVDALKHTAATLGGRGNLMFETASKPSMIRSNMAHPQDWQFKGANDVEPILGKMGVLPKQSAKLGDLYGEKGGYVGNPEATTQERRNQRFWESKVPGTSETQAQRYTENLGITRGPELLDIPSDRLSPEFDTRGVINHEWGHILIADMMGLPTKNAEMHSYLHPTNVDSSVAGSASIDLGQIPGVELQGAGRYAFTPEAMKENWDKMLNMLLGGGVAQEIIDGLPIQQNKSMTGDLGQVHRIGKALGYTRDQVSDMIDASVDKVREMLNHPATIDAIKNAAGTREEGLSKTLLASKEKIQDVLKKHREARDDYFNRGAATTGAVVPETEPRAAGGNAEGNVREDNRKAVQGRLFTKTGKEVEPPAPAPNEDIAKVANAYNREHGQPEIDHAAATLPSKEARAALADEYDRAEHNPNDPQVKRAYSAMKQETLDQFHHLQDAGIKFEFTSKDPYKSAAEMMQDVRDNHHLSVYTEGGVPADHPLAEVEPKTGQTYNTIFRAVHDVLGHTPSGHDFSEKGEESAFKSHAQMYSPEARPAVAAETQGQSNWFFNNKEVREGKEPGEFAAQKAIVLEGQKPWTRKATDMMDESPAGGINPRTGRPDVTGEVGSEIYTEGRGAKPLDHRPTERDLQAFYDKNKDVFEKHPELRIGWDHTDKGWELNIGATGTEEGAKKVGNALDQRAVWHIGDQREIPTGGTGEKTSFPNYPLEQRIADLKGGVTISSPELRTPDEPGSPLSTVPLIKNPLEIKGSGEEGRITTYDVAKALNKFSKNAAGRAELNKADPAEMVERAKNAMLNEAKYQLAQDNTGEHWYTKEINEHDAILREMHPELSDPVKMSLFKFPEAILSSGQKPYGNLKSAINAWTAYQETGEFPEKNPKTGNPWGPRGLRSYGAALDSINKLVKEKGEEGATDWLLTKHPISELHQYMTPSQSRVRGKATDLRYGAMILGPKRGPFALNLHGMESEFTADMWVSRTWNRLMGTMEFDHESGEITSDAPRNNQERDLMRQSFNALGNELGKSTSATQAIMWYYEQALYRAHGIPKETWSFSNAAKRIQQEQTTGEEKYLPEDIEEKHGQTRLAFTPPAEEK